MEGGFTPGIVLVGKYRVDGVLARGGMGSVVRVTDLASGEPLALKTMLPEIAANPEYQARFQREAHAVLGSAGVIIPKKGLLEIKKVLESVSLPIRFAVGFISVTAAILSGVQTFVRPSVRAEQHRAAQIGLERIVRDIETLLVLEAGTEPVDLSGSVDALSERLAEAQKLAPMPSVRDYAPSSLMFDRRTVEPGADTAATDPRVEATGTD